MIIYPGFYLDLKVYCLSPSSKICQRLLVLKLFVREKKLLKRLNEFRNYKDSIMFLVLHMANFTNSIW